MSHGMGAEVQEHGVERFIPEEWYKTGDRLERVTTGEVLPTEGVPDIGPPVPPPSIWAPLTVLKPFELTLLPPEQKFLGFSANMVLTAGLAVLGLGILMSVMKR